MQWRFIPVRHVLAFHCVSSTLVRIPGVPICRLSSSFQSIACWILVLLWQPAGETPASLCPTAPCNTPTNSRSIWALTTHTNKHYRSAHHGSHFINPLTAKLFNMNFYPLEVVSRWRDPQLRVSENYSDFTKWRSTVFKYCRFMPHFTLHV